MDDNAARALGCGTVIVAVVILGGISQLISGEDEEPRSEPTGERAAVEAECENVDYRVVEDVFRPEGQVRVAQAVRTSVPGGPLALPQNKRDYYLAIRTTAGIGVWATEEEVLKGSGTGLAFAADKYAREISDLGELADVGAMGIGPGYPDYGTALDCIDP